MKLDTPGFPTEVPDDDYEPYDERYLRKPLKNWEAYNLIIRGFLGTGLLLLPEAFRYSGVLVGIVDLVVVSIFVTHMYHLFMKSRITLCKILRVASLYYPQAMKFGFEAGPSCLRIFSPVIGIFVDMLCFLNQLNYLCSYLWHMSHDLERIFEIWYGQDFDHHSYVLILGPYLILAMCVTNLKVYAIFAVFSNVFTLVSLSMMIFYLTQDLPNFTLIPAFSAPSDHILFFVPALYALQSVPLVSTVELNMLKGKDFLRIPGILCQSYATLSIIYFVIGVLGYWRYEEKTVLLTHNMDVSSWLVKTSIILYFFGIYISYGLQGQIGIYVIWEHYLTLWINLRWEFLKALIEYIFRFSLFVILPMIVVIYLPTGMSLFLSIHGMCQAFLAIMFPALLDISLRWKRKKFGSCYWMFIKDLLLICLSCCLLVLSGYHGYRFCMGHPGSNW